MNKLSKIFMSIGILLIAISAALLIYNNYEETKAGKKSKEVLKAIKINLNNIPKDINTNKIDLAQTNEEMHTINIDGYDYIGTITIPSLGLELPIMSKYDNNSLKIAPARYYGSVYTNDLIICGHSYKTHFKYLSNLEQRDNIIFTDIEGQSYIYEVLEIEVLSPSEVSTMIDNEFDLTLYTCTDDGFNRITVRCNRVTNKV